MGVAQSKKRPVAEIEAADGADSTEVNLFPPVPSNGMDTHQDGAEGVFIEGGVTMDLTDVEHPTIAAAISEGPVAAISKDEAPADLDVAAAAEEPHAVGNVVYLLTFLGFLAWLVSQQNDNETKMSYCKTACTRISDFLTFLGNACYTAVFCLPLIILLIYISFGKAFRQRRHIYSSSMRS